MKHGWELFQFFYGHEKQGSSNTSVEFLSNAIPYFNYTIKWECDIKSETKVFVKFTMPEAEDKVTEEVIMTITKTKYKKSRDASRAFNALYDKVQ